MSLVTGSDPRPSRPGVKLTYDDFVLFPDDGKRHELIDGEHYVTPSPNLTHQAVSGNLHGRIWNYLQHHPIGKVYAAPLDVVFSHFDVVEPDLLYVRNARRDVLTVKNVQVDPDIDVVRVYRLQNGKYLRAQELLLDHGDVLTTPLLPGLDLPLSQIFAE